MYLIERICDLLLSSPLPSVFQLQTKAMHLSYSS